MMNTKYDIIPKTGVSFEFKWEYFKVPDFGKKNYFCGTQWIRSARGLHGSFQN